MCIFKISQGQNCIFPLCRDTIIDFHWTCSFQMYHNFVYGPTLALQAAFFQVIIRHTDSASHIWISKSRGAAQTAGK